MFQKAKEKGHAELTSLSAATSLASSIHQDALLAFIPNVPSVAITTPQATSHPVVRNVTDVVAITTLQPYAKEDHRDPKEAEPSLLEMQARHSDEDTTSLAAGARLAAPQHSPCQNSRMPAYSPSHSTSHNPLYSNRARCNRRSTPFQNYQDSIKVVPAPSTTDRLETQDDCPQKGSLLTKCMSDSQVASTPSFN